MEAVATSTRPARLKKPGHGTRLRLIREAAKKKANIKADKARAKRIARKASLDDVVFDQKTPDGVTPVYHVTVLGQRVGTVKLLGDKAVLFNNAADEISSRARLRDLKKASAGLYVGMPTPMPGKGRDVAEIMRNAT